ncbi:DUF2969 family protein [Lacticaseibacillus salsurivasis]|uniref:DUF2969 family protein n=1 Tax=Lacticaseibacillus salsurivasis TaxID=3081441 RepID=UPI0030C68694
MAKEQKITVQQEEVTRNGHTVSVLTVGKVEIGYIEPEADGKHFQGFVAGSMQGNRFKNLADAENYLLSEYHLHRA